MHKKSLTTFAAFAVVIAFAASVAAQNTNSNTSPSRQTTTRQRTTTTTTTTATPDASAPSTAQQDATPPTTTTTRTTTTRTTRASRAARNAENASQAAVRAAFDELIDGITRADVDAVMSVYWNSPQLIIFNNNGTVTKSWAQVRANRESAYPKLKDVKIALRDVRVQMVGADAAFVSYLWTQTQVADGTPESATGRSTLLFRRIGTAWKVVHGHTSPDAPDPSRLLPSEQTAPPANTSTTPTTTTRPATTSPTPTRP
jgi:ketosteroid isomerase-like protein